MRCLTGARFSMDAEILHWSGIQDADPDVDVSSGHWETYQDPITGEIRNEWVADPADNPDTPEVETTTITVPCLVRGIVDGGIRVAGTTERFGDTYQNIEFVKMWTPAWVKIAKSDRVTNIRWKKNGDIVWIDEEYLPNDTRPTVFNVNGVTPLFDAFNQHIENFILLEKAEANG